MSPPFHDSSTAYRLDIDGLRAIAVLAVVCYHLSIGPFAGGFVGVDVFFVISGYLITGIVQRQVEVEKFSYAAFYEKRVRRLAPALFAVLLATLAIGIWILLPTDLILLGKSTLSTLLFGSNIFFLRQSGYFDSTSAINPLLNMWSLAVEEQFYMALPVLLLLVHRFARTRLRTALAVCAVLSFAGCVVAQTWRPAAPFYLSPFRAWELLVGGLLAVDSLPVITNRWVCEAVSGAALLALFGSTMWMEAGATFPGWRAAIPVLATGVLIHAGEQAGATSTVHRVLRSRPLTFVGLISYSLYLWHWPLLALTKYEEGMPAGPLGSERWLILTFAVVLAVASYRWIEQPLRRNTPQRTYSRTQVFRAATAAGCMLAGIALVVTLDRGLQFRASREVAAVDALRAEPVAYAHCDARTPDEGLCRIGDPHATPVSLLWGDSWAVAWAPAFDAALRRRRESAYLAVHSACAPLLGVMNPVAGNDRCLAFTERTVAWIRQHRPSIIFMVASWPSYASPRGQFTLHDSAGHVGNTLVFASAFERTVDAVAPLSRTLLVVGPTPGAPGNVLLRLALSLEGKSTLPAAKSTEEVESTNAYFWRVALRTKSEGSHGLILVDPTPWFCGSSHCRYLAPGGLPLYRDDGGHLNDAGAKFIAPMLSSTLHKELGKGN